MKNYDSKIQMINKRLSKKPLLDPEYVFQQIDKFICMGACDLDGKMMEIKEEDRVALYDFVFIANYELTISGSEQDDKKKSLWVEIEKGIRENNGFKPDERDEEALKIKLF